jgi:hypothetical protein
MNLLRLNINLGYPYDSPHTRLRDLNPVLYLIAIPGWLQKFGQLEWIKLTGGGVPT